MSHNLSFKFQSELVIGLECLKQRRKYQNELKIYCMLSQTAGKARYTVWVLTAGGVVYRIQVSGAASGWMLCGNQQHDVSADVQRMHEVTAFAATPEILCLGGRSGSIICVLFGIGSPEAGEL